MSLWMYVGIFLDEKEDEKLKKKNNYQTLLVPVSYNAFKC